MSETDETGEKSKLANLIERVATRKIRQAVIAENGKPHLFSPKHLRFLDHYSKNLDYEEALKQSGMTAWDVEKSTYLSQEVQLINELAMYRHRAGSALGRHERLMDKMEEKFDTVHDVKTAASFGSILAKMSETSLKAAGEFTEKRENTGLSGVQVIINIGDPLMNGNVIDVQPDK